MYCYSNIYVILANLFNLKINIFTQYYFNSILSKVKIFVRKRHNNEDIKKLTNNIKFGFNKISKRDLK